MPHKIAKLGNVKEQTKGGGGNVCDNPADPYPSCPSGLKIVTPFV